MCTFYIPLWPGCLHAHLALFLPSGGDSEDHEDEEVHLKRPATNGADWDTQEHVPAIKQDHQIAQQWAEVYAMKQEQYQHVRLWYLVTLPH